MTSKYSPLKTTKNRENSDDVKILPHKKQQRIEKIVMTSKYSPLKTTKNRENSDDVKILPSKNNKE